MAPAVDLVWFGPQDQSPRWSPGQVWATQPTVHAVRELIQKRLPETNADAWLFWDARLRLPNSQSVQEMLSSPSDVWHAGLQLGTSALPALIDFVQPTWMLNRDPDPCIEATSWRMSFRACLIRTEVLRRMGEIDGRFRSLDGAALELGHRYITGGVFMRQMPSLLGPAGAQQSKINLPFEDELRFVHNRFGRFWALWALGRAVCVGYCSLPEASSGWRKVSRSPRPLAARPFKTATCSQDCAKAQVSVVIPTLDRYSYLRTLLNQLRQQTHQPSEIIVVDQTAAGERDTTLADAFSDLPVAVLYQERPGQCSSRNAALRRVQGEYILFLDDDDEITPELIESHLACLAHFRCDVSSGVANEIGAGPLPEDFKRVRTSNVFPTNNTLVRRQVLNGSGLFDLAYEHGQRADGDLGMRIYLSGALMVLNPQIRVLHHHAPRGGLRAHKARVVTYAQSRSSLTKRNLPSATEIYLTKRYFTPRQVNEMLCISTLGTLSVRGSVSRHLLKMAIGLFLLPNTAWQIYRACRSARGISPSIPRLAESQPTQIKTDG